MIRPYSPDDQEQLIEILRRNTPEYFAVSEEEDFNAYLEQHVEQYFVVEEGERIIGAGGINYFDDYTLARISWDLIHPDFQGKGIGKELMRYRMDEIRKKNTVRVVVVRTTQLVYRFYQKMGFVLERTEKDFWAKGFDLYQMKLELTKTTARSDFGM
ncbi:GNAT family N-acetyltransferase [Pontibacter sp. HJ8]